MEVVGWGCLMRYVLGMGGNASFRRRYVDPENLNNKIKLLRPINLISRFESNVFILRVVVGSGEASPYVLGISLTE